MRRLVCLGVVWSVLGFAAGPVGAAPQREVSVEALGKRLDAWVADADPAAHARAVARVQQGVPPGALATFLAAARAHPDARYAAIIEQSTRYRNVTVRGRALAALAAQGPTQAERAIGHAADDHDATIRRLAWALSNLHPSPAAHEIVAALLARDPALAQAIAEETAAEDSDDDEIVLFDDDAESGG